MRTPRSTQQGSIPIPILTPMEPAPHKICDRAIFFLITPDVGVNVSMSGQEVAYIVRLAVQIL